MQEGLARGREMRKHMQTASRSFSMNLTSIVLILVASARALAADKSPAPPDPKPLQPMLKIDWKKGPSLPQGFQDSDGGIIDNMLITVCGFCGGGKTGVPGKETKYPRGFLTKTWGLDVGNPQRGWHSLPDFPGAARQELFAIVVDSVLYCWGGFSYTAPSCYKDGYRLSKPGSRLGLGTFARASFSLVVERHQCPGLKNLCVGRCGLRCVRRRRILHGD